MSSNFFVHVVESPSSDDLLDGDLEGRVLYQALCASRIDSSYMVAATKKALWKAIGERLLQRIRQDQFQRWPILHLSAHGLPEGLSLSDGDFLRWSELTGYLRELNSILRGNLILSVSSCHGAHALQEALEGDQPYHALIGPATTVPLSDLAIGFSAFYHVLSKTWDLPLAHRAMTAAAANPAFQLWIVEQARTNYQNWKMQQFVNRLLGNMKQEGLPQPSEEPPAQ